MHRHLGTSVVPHGARTALQVRLYAQDRKGAQLDVAANSRKGSGVMRCQQRNPRGDPAPYREAVRRRP